MIAELPLTVLRTFATSVPMVEHGRHPALNVARPSGADAEVGEYPWVVRFP
jgi:hypothetical protein